MGDDIFCKESNPIQFFITFTSVLVAIVLQNINEDGNIRAGGFLLQSICVRIGGKCIFIEENGSFSLPLGVLAVYPAD